MISFALLTALLQTGGTAPVPYHLAGREVPLTFPSTQGPSPLSNEVVRWDGWKLGGFAEAAPWKESGPWQEVASLLAAARAKQTADTPTWRAKVFLLTNSDLLCRTAEGRLFQRRRSLEDPEITAILAGLARFAGMVEASTGGALKVDLQAEIDREFLWEYPVATEENQTDAFLTHYLTPRINGGRFEADDRIDRGPYDSVFVVHPFLLRPSQTSFYELRHTLVNGTPAQSVPLTSESFEDPIAELPRTLWLRWLLCVNEKGLMDSMKSLPDFAKNAARSPWKDRVGHMTLTPEVMIQLPRWPRQNVPGHQIAPETLSLSPDPVRGTVLTYRETGSARFGGAWLPPLSHASGRYLSFWAKSTSMDPVAIAWSEGQEVVLGKAPLQIGGTSPAARTVDFRTDGTWQRIVVDLGDAQPDVIAIHPPTGGETSERRQIGLIVYQFDDFELLSELPAGLSPTTARQPVPNAQSEEEDDRVLAALQAQTPAELLALLTDPSDLVKLNATARLTQMKVQGSVVPLQSNLNTINPRLAETALRALAFQDTDEGWQAIRRSIYVGAAERPKQVAAELLGAQKGRDIAGAVSGLIASTSWVSRQAAATAIGRLEGESAQLVLMAFLQELNPAVRFSAIQGADPKVDLVARRLQWAAVNDPSDAIRAESCIRLIQMAAPPYKKDAFRGVRDESLWVRYRLVSHFRQHPTEEAREALRLAIVDPNAIIRAETLYAFAELPEPVRTEEIQNVLDDTDPTVRQALEYLMSKKTLTPPASRSEHAGALR